MTAITGAGGGGGGKGGGGGGSSRTPSTTPDSLDSRQYANVVDLISEGEIGIS
jgi:predicted phage tail protein